MVLLYNYNEALTPDLPFFYDPHINETSNHPPSASSRYIEAIPNFVGESFSAVLSEKPNYLLVVYSEVGVL